MSPYKDLRPKGQCPPHVSDGLHDLARNGRHVKAVHKSTRKALGDVIALASTVIAHVCKDIRNAEHGKNALCQAFGETFTQFRGFLHAFLVRPPFCKRVRHSALPQQLQLSA